MWTNEVSPERHQFQVLLSVYNAEKYLAKCLESLNTSLRGHDWILLYGDDASTDEGTVELAKSARALTCDKVHLFDYDKAKTVGEAKNRLIKEAAEHSQKYPYILFMDADDEMLPERVRMIETAKEKNSKYVVGGWKRQKLDGSRITVSSANAAKNLCYGPWATLFHYDFFLKDVGDKPFFPEDSSSNSGHEDLLTWYHLKHIENKIPTIHDSDEPVHLYMERKDSVSNFSDKKQLNIRRNSFWSISELIRKEKRNIYKNPLSEEEMEIVFNKYIHSTKNKIPAAPLH